MRQPTKENKIKTNVLNNTPCKYIIKITIPLPIKQFLMTFRQQNDEAKCKFSAT